MATVKPSSKKQFSIISWNARGFYAAHRQRKTELINYLETLSELPDVLCIQESHATSKTTYTRLTGYQAPINTPRSNGQKGGGVVTFIRKGVNFTNSNIITKSTNTIEANKVTCYNRTSQIEIFNCYAPNAKAVSRENLDETLLSISNRAIIVGDFNI